MLNNFYVIHLVSYLWVICAFWVYRVVNHNFIKNLIFLKPVDRFCSSFQQLSNILCVSRKCKKISSARKKIYFVTHVLSLFMLQFNFLINVSYSIIYSGFNLKK